MYCFMIGNSYFFGRMAYKTIHSNLFHFEMINEGKISHKKSAFTNEINQRCDQIIHELQ